MFYSTESSRGGGGGPQLLNPSTPGSPPPRSPRAPGTRSGERGDQEVQLAGLGSELLPARSGWGRTQRMWGTRVWRGALSLSHSWRGASPGARAGWIRAKQSGPARRGMGRAQRVAVVSLLWGGVQPWITPPATPSWGSSSSFRQLLFKGERVRDPRLAPPRASLHLRDRGTVTGASASWHSVVAPGKDQNNSSIAIEDQRWKK